MCLHRNAVKVADKTGRLEFFYASLLATRRVFDVYSSVPAERFTGLCFTLWVQFNHAVLNGVKLAACEADGWDVQHARSILTFPEILHNQVSTIEEIISRRGIVLEFATDSKDVFARFLLKVHHAVRWCESSQLPRIEAQGLNNQPSEPNESLEAVYPGEPLAGFDEAFWQNFFDDNWMLVGDGISI